MNWEDVTTYRRGDTERTPSILQCRAGGLRIAIIRGHQYYPGAWIMNCRDIGIEEWSLGISDKEPIERAQALAIKTVKARLQEITVALESITAA